MSRWQPVADGVYEHSGSIISVGRGANLAISQKRAHMRVWVGVLPDNWRLCEALPDLEALAVPVEEIERILREHDACYGYRREANLRVRRVQRWLDSLPKERG